MWHSLPWSSREAANTWLREDRSALRGRCWRLFDNHWWGVALGEQMPYVILRTIESRLTSTLWVIDDDDVETDALNWWHTRSCDLFPNNLHVQDKQGELLRCLWKASVPKIHQSGELPYRAWQLLNSAVQPSELESSSKQHVTRLFYTGSLSKRMYQHTDLLTHVGLFPHLRLGQRSSTLFAFLSLFLQPSHIKPR